MQGGSEKKTVAESGTFIRRRKVDSSDSKTRAEAPVYQPGREQQILIQTLEHAGQIKDVLPYAFSLELFEPVKLARLPEGYFFKGGAVREILRRLLHPCAAELEIRDFDILRFAETPDSQDHALSLQYMRDDYEFGRGVEVSESFEAYFETRDLTVNEVLYKSGILSCSYRAVADLKSLVLRPTAHVSDALGGVDSRTHAKAHRLQAEASIKNIRYQMLGFPADAELRPFDLALNLDRALENSIEAAGEYLQSIWSAGFLMPELEVPPGIAQAAEHLASRLPKGFSIFRHLPAEVVQQLANKRV